MRKLRFFLELCQNDCHRLTFLAVEQVGFFQKIIPTLENSPSLVLLFFGPSVSMNGIVQDSVLALKSSYRYVFSTVPVNLIQDEFYSTLKKLVLSLCDTALSLVYVLAYVTLILAKLAILVFPHAVKLGNLVVDFHRTKLSKSDILIEVLSIGVLLTSFIFRVRIQKAWKSFLHSVSSKSKVAAKAAPHVMFFTFAILFAVLGRNFLLPLTSSAVMPIFTLVLPLLASVRVLTRMKTMDEESKKKEIATKLLLWVIVSIYHAIVTLASLIPFSNKLLWYLPYAKEMVIVVMVWVQISQVFSQIVFDSIISKILVKLCAMVPGGFSVAQADDKASTFFSILKMMYLVNDAQLAFLQALFQDSVATILAVFFMFTPSIFATAGMVTIALLLPAFRTAAAVASSSAFASETSQELAKLARPVNAGAAAPRTNTNTTSSSGLSSFLSATPSKNKAISAVENSLNTHWLRYWVCLSVLWCVRIYCLAIWPSVMIVATLWLQHSYFQGSSQLPTFLIGTSLALVVRNNRIQAEREREGEEGGGDSQTDLAALETDSNVASSFLSPTPATTTAKKEKGAFSLAGALNSAAKALFTPTKAVPVGQSSKASVQSGRYGVLSEAEAEEKISPNTRGSDPYKLGSEDSKDRMERNEVVGSSGGSGDSGRSSRNTVCFVFILF